MTLWVTMDNEKSLDPRKRARVGAMWRQCSLFSSTRKLHHRCSIRSYNKQRILLLGSSETIAWHSEDLLAITYKNWLLGLLLEVLKGLLQKETTLKAILSISKIALFHYIVRGWIFLEQTSYIYMPNTHIVCIPNLNT